MANKKVTPKSITEPYKKRKGDFAPDLVGNQFTNGTSLFTLGNFSIETNLQPKEDITYETGVYSDIYTLDNLNLTESQSLALDSNSINVKLNLDPTDITKFAYYGSFYEFLRVSVEGIITKWKGSLYITDDLGGYSDMAKNTLLNYSYDELTNISKLTIPTLYVENNFGLITNDLGGFILDPADISNIKLNQTNYELKNDFGTFNLISYTGDTENVNPYISIEVEGEAFPSLGSVSFGTFKYHLKPKDDIVDRLFFDNLSDFENVLMNRLVSPKYTATFEAPIETESGVMVSTRKTYTWPTTDGYNIDIDTIEYSQYLEGLLRLASDYDRLKSNLMTRKYVSGSILEFDTDDGGESVDEQGRKINKLLKIYGREFDEVKKYVDSIQDARVVTYNKKDNMPDELIKNMAKTLGFDTIKSVTNNELLTYISTTNEVIFSGQSRTMSTKEIDIELWRRLIINAWWLFKSKGHRKVVEFLVNLFGLNECLINLDEHVYVAKDKLDVEDTFDKIEDVLSRELPEGITVDVDRDEYPIDEDGFPRVLPNTNDYYFQMDGFWYGNGSQSTIGNNPHYGPYDYGGKYFDKFRCFIDDFSGETTTILQTFTENVNLFPDYNKGDLEITFEDGKPLEDYGVDYAVNMLLNNRVSKNTNLNEAGFTIDKSRTGRGSLRLNFSTCGEDTCEIGCPEFRLDDINGVVTDENGTPLTQQCCLDYNFKYSSSEVGKIFKVGLTDEESTILDDYENNLKQTYGNDVITLNSNLCFWCEPTTFISDYNTYFNKVYSEYGVDGIVTLALKGGLIVRYNNGVESFINSLGNDKEGTLKTISDYYNNLYGNYYIMVHTDVNKAEVSERCCLVRGGQWNTVSGKEICSIPKPIEPVEDCVCELPDSCDYKQKGENYYNFGLLECTDYCDLLESGQNDSNLIYDGLIYDTFFGDGVKRSGYYNDGCYEEYYGLGSYTGYTDSGDPYLCSTAPCLWEECKGKEPGEIVTCDLEDISGSQRQFRDTSLKAKNEFSLATSPFFLASETMPFWFLSGCGFETCDVSCGCEVVECFNDIDTELTTREVEISLCKYYETVVNRRVIDEGTSNETLVTYRYSCSCPRRDSGYLDDGSFLYCLGDRVLNDDTTTVNELLKNGQPITNQDCCTEAYEFGRVITDDDGVTRCIGAYTKSLYE